MAAGTLTGQAIKDTYKRLLKLKGTVELDTITALTNGIQIEDGDGIDIPIYLSTDKIGIGTSTPSVQLELSDDFKVNKTSTFVEDALFSSDVLLGGDFLPAITNTSTLGNASVTYADLYLGDGSNIYFGEDQDVVLRHIEDCGLRLLNDNTLEFRDVGAYIKSGLSNHLNIYAGTEVQIDAGVMLDINVPSTAMSGALNVSGAVTIGSTLNVTGLSTFQGIVNLGTAVGDSEISIGNDEGDSVSFGADVVSHILPNSTVEAFNLGSTGKRWNDIWINGTANLASVDIEVLELL